ncbi:MAG: glycosyltransferase family 4 protein [Gammaproteobacteria bacterium]|nr:glycosyltransferase family 4 protein [Gammaproteobacteria bacterium]
MKSMRIAHVSATFPPYMGGTGNVCFHTARELASRGHRVYVYTAAYSGAPAYEIKEGVIVHRLSPWLQVGNARFLPDLIRMKGFDLIHLHYPFYGGELSSLAAWIHRCPLVITYHQDVLLPGWKSLVEKCLRWSLERWVLRSADIILFTSQDYAQASFIRPILRGLEDRIYHLPNGVDTALFCLKKVLPNDYQRCDFEVGDYLVMMVASLDQAHYFKGVEVFLRALESLPHRVKGLIIGDGDLRPNYETLSKALNLEARISFTGQVSESVLADYYRLADVTVLPSVTMGEAFGLVLIESLACGTPVIASNLPGVRTVVDDTKDGYLVKPDNAADLARKIQLLMENPDKSREMEARG